MENLKEKIHEIIYIDVNSDSSALNPYRIQ